MLDALNWLALAHLWITAIVRTSVSRVLGRPQSGAGELT
jgi:hypothetical protein